MVYQRITESYMNQTVLNNLFVNRSMLIDLQEQIASGKKFDRVSEDVYSGASVLNTSSSLGRIETYLKNVNTARSEMEIADEAILTSLDSVHTAKELTIQALNATCGPEEMNMIGNQIEQIIEQIKDIGNTKLGTNYIFGGQNTGTAPFSDGLNPGEIQYNGSSDGSANRDIEIAEGVTLTVNIGGDEIFGYYYTGDHDNDILTPDTTEGQGLLNTLITLKEELQLAAPDKDVIRTCLGDLDGDLQTLLQAQSTLGGMLTRLDVTESIHESNKINLTEAKSDAQDVDMAKAISDLSFQETALRASLEISAKVIQPSLLNYL